MAKNLKKLSLLFTFVLTITIFAACGDNKPTVMKDREGTEFKLPKQVKRIVSTAPSNTEVLVALGLSDSLVAIDKYSSDIQGVKSDLPQLDFRTPDNEKIIGLKPDIIIASGHNKSGDTDPFKAIKEAGIPVAYIPSSFSINGIYDDIDFIAKVTSTEQKGKELIENMKKEVEAIRAIGSKVTDKKKVYFEIGNYGTLSTFGYDTFLNEMIEIIGGTNIFKDQKSWISVGPESVVSANPDVIFVNTPGTNESGKTAKEDVMSRQGWNVINAVKNNSIYDVDKNASSRPSQNVVKALKEMAKYAYPDLYKNI